MADPDVQFPVAFPRKQGNGPYRVLRAFRDEQVRTLLQDLADPEAAQRRSLNRILSEVHGSRFAQEHDLDGVSTAEMLRDRIPIQPYGAFAPYIERLEQGEPNQLTRAAPSMLLETSGTTGAPKHLPVTRAWEHVVRDVQALWVLCLVREHQAAAQGKALTIVSPMEQSQTPGGLPIGSNTGRMHLAQPWIIRRRYPVPYDVFALAPPDLKLYALLLFAVTAPVTTLTTANPSTILLLCRRLQEWSQDLAADIRDGTLRRGPAADLDPNIRKRLERKLKKARPPSRWKPLDLWPLCAVNCWKGGPAPFFVDLLPEALGGEVPIREVGVTASEGYFAIPLGGDWRGSVMIPGSHFMEVILDSGDPRFLWELEPGDIGRLVITTEAGLVRYDLDDRIEVIGMCQRSPVIRFLGKGQRMLNVMGEKVTAAQVGEAMRGFDAVGFTSRLVLAEIPHFEIAVEGTLSQQDLAVFDKRLQQVNVEYASKRSTGRLSPPTLLLLRPGTYRRFRTQRVRAGAPDSQVKDPILAINDEEWRAVVEA